MESVMKDSSQVFEISPIGRIHSTLKQRSGAPRQAWEGAPSVTLQVFRAFVEALEGITAGQEVWVLTWLHESTRGVLKVHPRRDPRNPIKGVFATRSPDRPNPIGLHRTTVLRLYEERFLEVRLEAIDGTPVIDIKPVLEEETLQFGNALG